MADLSLETSEVVFQVLQELYNDNTESYGKSIERATNLTQGQVGDALKTLLEADIIEKGKRTQSQYYNINKEGLSNYVAGQLGIENSEKLSRIVDAYTYAYLGSNRTTTIHQMLAEDFAQGISTYVKRMQEEPPEEYQEIVEEIMKNTQEKAQPEDIVYLAFKNLD